MRYGKREQELMSLEDALEQIPRSLAEIKTRGCKVKSCQKEVRKDMARFEAARRVCLALPKPWNTYQSHGKMKDLYTRPEVQEIHNALKKLDWSESHLKRAIESYQKRYDERKELKARLRLLPDEIESAKALSEIEAKRKAEREAKAKPKDWKNKWYEVAPGFVVTAQKFKAYLRTFDRPIPFNEDTVTIQEEKDNWSERIKYNFIFKPSYRMKLKLPCYTWEQAERAS